VIERIDYSGELTDRLALGDRLHAAGLGRAASARRAELLATAAAAWKAARPAPTARPKGFFVPGRIEVLGKHTDYAGGQTMVVAAERGFSLVVSPRSDPLVVVIDAVRREAAGFELAPGLVPRLGHWSNYPATVARRIARNFPGACRGATIVLASDLPPAAGMSSSSAFIVAGFLALAEVNGLANRREFQDNVHDPTDLAGYLATIENGQTFGSLAGDRGVGTFGGSEDHTAILCGRPGQISQYAYCPVRFQRTIPVPPGYTLAVGVSGVVAEKTGAAREKYNAASRLAAMLVELWRRATGRSDPHLAAVLAGGPDAAERLRQAVATAEDGGLDRQALLRRLDHFLVENERVLPAAGEALARGDLGEFGALVDRSQRAAEELLGNQVPETSRLAASARSLGAAAASAFGAGFGGSVWALVETARADEFLRAWAESYRARFPERAPRSDFFVTGAGPAALQVG